MTDQVARELAEGLAPRLALLHAVAVEGHLTRAAQRIGVPQPTASRWLTELADQVGAPLIVRDGRGIRCSRLGAELAAGAGVALAALEATCRQVVAQADPERGQVALAFLHTMGEQRVPALLGRFRAGHPGVRFTLRQGGHEDVLEWLRTGEVDLALTSPLPDTPGFATARVAEQDLVVTVPAGHRLAGRRRVRLSELAGEQFVGLKRRYGLRGITDEMCAAAGFVPVLAFEGDEADTLRGLVAAGLGVAILPTAEHPLADGVVELSVSPRATRVIGLVWTADRALPPAAATFRDFALDTRAGRTD
ncbi:MAG TPA: LysR family transcriptional regulator [Pseudonocardiaceae bacterium]|nr:LysR family transcriptional regulator [Pseudonocardiaceae bacterium]